MSAFKLFSLESKVALITGATSGIGVSMAESLAQFKAKQIIFVYRQSKDPSELIQLLKKASKENGNDSLVISTICEDLSEIKIDEIEPKIYKKALDLSVTGKIDILINNAGISEVHPFTEFPDSEYNKILHVNLHVPSKLTQLVGKHMIDNKIKGKIIITCSLYSFQGGLEVVPYTISKGAVKSFVQALSNEWAPKGICVNGIAPGVIKTNMTKFIEKNKEKSERVLKRIPKGYYGSPDDFRGTTVFLCSDASDYITGEIITVDGGYMAY